ncbi:hypothetical protein BKA64DRAFT_667835 [Cadophora sp. MPI-SDFR-AT-0126]|nr:hypothetical protein BKA64DRAFT_667835 [Leotiomycetes sp. MPI-SDFR-AT-0126]
MDDDDALPPSSNASGHPLTMKEQAEIFKERLYENFMPNTRRPYIKTPLNLFNRPAGRRPTRQPGFIPPDKKKDVWHHHNLRGNPPPGVSPAYWDKTFNDAHSRVYNRLKKVSNSQVRKIAWDAAKSPENGQMRDLALCLLVERDQLLLPFTDSNP